MNLEALRETDVSSHIVAQGLMENADKYQCVYAVAITHDGQPEVYSTSDITLLPLAVLVLQETALSFIRPKG